MFQKALLNEIVAFVAVADCGSFTGAAELLSSTKSGTGKAVKKLEDGLGLKLFHRTTRRLTLTEEGRIFLEASKHAMDTINEAKLLLESRKDEPAGRLRVNLPIGIGRNVVNNLKHFTQQYSKVTVELSLSDRFDDAIQGEWDVVVRIGELEDSSFIAKKLSESKRVLCASTDYLNTRGVPQSLQELRIHDALMFRTSSGKLRPWIFKERQGSLTEITPNPLAILSDGRSFVDAVIAGMGIAQVYDVALGAILQQGDVVELFPEFAVAGPPINALIPSGRVMPAKTKAFLEFLKAQFGS